MRTLICAGNNASWLRFHGLRMTKRLSTTSIPDSRTDREKTPASHEQADEFEQRIFGGVSGNDSRMDAFFQKLDNLQTVRNRTGSRKDEGSNSSLLDGLRGSYNTSSERMEDKLTKAATHFNFDMDKLSKESLLKKPAAGHDQSSGHGSQHTRPRKPAKWKQFEVTTKEALRKADFRNVRFLANFITEGGIIIKRDKTGISAKAQRKIAREIKIARALGLMPFTTMGTKAFVFGKSMEPLMEDFEYRRRLVNPASTAEEREED